MRNILRDGEKPEIIKIMPFGKTVALALLLALSGCVKKNHDPKTFPAEQSYGVGEKEVVSDFVSLEHHPDYAIKKNSEYYYQDKNCPDPETCTEVSVVVKDGADMYVRAEVDSIGRPVLIIGSYDEQDSTETRFESGVVPIESAHPKK